MNILLSFIGCVSVLYGSFCQGLLQEPVNSIGLICSGAIEAAIPENGVIQAIHTPVLFYIVFARLFSASVISALSAVLIDSTYTHKPFKIIPYKAVLFLYHLPYL